MVKIAARGSNVAKDQAQIQEEFFDLVNMTSRQLSEWLETDEAESVGQDSGDGESKGHKSGRRILALKEKDGFTDDDFEHMNKVVSYIKRHSAQRPSGDVKESDWRYSLMNWGHDPCKDDEVNC